MKSLISYRIALRMVKAIALLTRTDLPYPLPYFYPITNTAIGSRSIISRLLKGVYHIRPPVPRYSTTWDATKVISYLKTLFSLYQVNLKNMTFKTVMLCALSSAQREQTLCALDLNNLTESESCLNFVITDRLKNSKRGKSTVVTFECLPNKPKICTKCTQTEYISRTSAFRGTDPHLCVSKLFTSYVKPRKRVCTDTLARWIKSVLNQFWCGHVGI